jgi:hypothetical protein
MRIMKYLHRKLLSYIFILVFAVSNAAAATASSRASYFDDDQEPTAGEMLADTVLVRPPMFLATVVGAVVFVITLPFSALGGNVDEAGETLVLDPAKYTFLRPLGDL